MAITKRVPKGPKLPRSIQALDVLFAQARNARPGPSSSKRASRVNSVDSNASLEDSDLSFSSHVHPSRVPPYLQHSKLSEKLASYLPITVASTPIQLLTVDSDVSSSDIPDLAQGVQGANENNQKFLGPTVFSSSRSSPSRDCVEETPFQLTKQVVKSRDECSPCASVEAPLSPLVISPLKSPTIPHIKNCHENTVNQKTSCAPLVPILLL